MGIRLVTMKDGRVQLLQTTTQAHTVEDARDGMLFMQEMIQLSKNAAVQEEPQSRVVKYHEEDAADAATSEDSATNADAAASADAAAGPPTMTTSVVELMSGPAQFGYDLATRPPIKAPVVIVKPFNGCGDIENSGSSRGEGA